LPAPVAYSVIDRFYAFPIRNNANAAPDEEDSSIQSLLIYNKSMKKASRKIHSFEKNEKFLGIRRFQGISKKSFRRFAAFEGRRLISPAGQIRQV